jgi:membrane fusion protein, multidrug efflux system
MATQVSSPTFGQPISKVPVSPEQIATRQRRRLQGLRLALLGAAVIGAGVLGVNWWNRLRTFEETDDAYLTGHNHPLSFRVAGTVEEVLVDDNQAVKKGQPLASLDSRDFEVAAKQAEAAAKQAIAQVDQARAQIQQSTAQLAKARLDLNRATDLLKQKVNSQADFDNAQAAYDVAAANDANARAALEVAQAQAGVAQAQLENAKLQLSYTTLYAPTDGRIGKKTLEIGQRVQPGQMILADVAPDIWVSANFKETQLRRMRVGQPVEIRVDAVKDKVFQGKVDSLQPGTGAVFALLPPDNATGNFTKIVQRVPVKIVFDPDSIQGEEERLVPGLSVVPAVRVK